MVVGGESNMILKKKKKIGHVFIFQSIKDVHQSAPRATTSFPSRTFRKPKGTLIHTLQHRETSHPDLSTEDTGNFDW